MRKSVHFYTRIYKVVTNSNLMQCLLRNGRIWTNPSVQELFHLAIDQYAFRNVVANLYWEDCMKKKEEYLWKGVHVAQRALFKLHVGSIILGDGHLPPVAKRVPPPVGTRHRRSRPKVFLFWVGRITHSPIGIGCWWRGTRRTLGLRWGRVCCSWKHHHGHQLPISTLGSSWLTVYLRVKNDKLWANFAGSFAFEQRY